MQPKYWNKAKTHLKAADPVLGKIITQFPKQSLVSRGEAFTTLCRSIVGQQISVKAASTIWGRFSELAPTLNPETVLAIEIAALRSAGLSARKAEYIRDLARHFGERLLQVEHWPDMTDEEIIQDLIRVRGIGRWSAEMFLMFTLMRPNVLPVDDVGLQRGVQVAYRLRKKPTAAKIKTLAKKWEPYRTVATWYLWRSLEPVSSY